MIGVYGSSLVIPSYMLAFGPHISSCRENVCSLIVNDIECLEYFLAGEEIGLKLHTIYQLII